ncbi:MAG: acetyl-CoA carboxylase carboxyl transferase subunit alpha, partial [Alphaproteobacteria bacterium]
GEGGSGGAVALATADRVAMLSNAIYSVISPEGCASILWKDASRAAEAAEALKLTAQDLMALGVIDRIIEEPVGGAHRHRETVIDAVGAALTGMLDELEGQEDLRAARRRRYLEMGARGLAA